MTKLTITSMITVAALAAPTAVATAADRIVVPEVDAVIARDEGPAISKMTALKGNIVWVRGDAPNQTLMRRGAGGTVKRVKGAPTGSYPSIDLGITRRGKLVLTYLRCRSRSKCKALSDDLDGRRVSFRRLVPRRCELSTAPARWRNRVAYGLLCDRLRGKPKVHSAKRSGLFVRKGGRVAKRLRLPGQDPRSGTFSYAEYLQWVDLRGIGVAASGGDVARFVFSQTVNGSRLRVAVVAGSEGDTEEWSGACRLARAGRCGPLSSRVTSASRAMPVSGSTGWALMDAAWRNRP